MTFLDKIIVIVGIALFLILIVLLWVQLYPLVNNRTKKREQKLWGKSFPIVCAGKPISATEARSANIKYNTFWDENGKKLDPEKYRQFVVKGNSMKFCGIFDNNLIFVKRGFRITDLLLDKFPYILVIKNADPEPGKSEYKLRRAWGLAQYNENNTKEESLVKLVIETINSEKFQAIKDLEENGEKVYISDEAILTDFKNKRIPEYVKKYIDCASPNEWNQTVVISTTFDTDAKEIHFSIHPISLIVGEVSEVFNVSQKAILNKNL